MRNTILTLLVVLLSVSLYAQKRSDFKGPEYKNYKPWLHKSEPTLVYTVETKTKLTGPEHKNQKPWKNKANKDYVAIVYGSDRSKLKGPAYKNYKPWLKDND
ncbi:hypothetical protein [uncultured Algibacter sp.]|uniref:hypothetical protein n=1 Tax=uncultured Algibacter sp. TaxID=298659 RepID=UPI002619595A|nr:hypothetical protein [uncultured Algibacter sp.]